MAKGCDECCIGKRDARDWPDEVNLDVMVRVMAGRAGGDKLT